MVDVVRRADLLQQPVLHDRDLITHRHRLGLVVGDVNHRRREGLLKVHDLGAKGETERGVERGQRLVHEKRPRLAHDRLRGGDPLALAAAHLARHLVEQGLDAEDPRRFDHALALFLPCKPAALETHDDVLPRGEVRVEQRRLEHHGDVALVRRKAGDVVVIEEDAAVGHGLEARDAVQCRGLAAARGAEENHEVPVGHVEGQVFHGDVRAMKLAQVLHGYGRHDPKPQRNGSTRFISAMCRCRK